MALGRLEILQEAEVGGPLPVAVITGPNDHVAITSYIQGRHLPENLDVEIIQQAAKPVFIPDGNPVFWDDGAVLEAPNGTGGCLAALRDSHWFAEHVARGRKFVFVWYANDPAAVEHMTEVVDGLNDTACAWALDEKGQAICRQLAGVPAEERDPRLVEALEDCGAACAVRSDFLDVLVRACGEHAVEKEIPVPLPDGTWARGVKREYFLSDSTLSSDFLLEHDSPASLEGGWGVPRVGSRAAQFPELLLAGMARAAAVDDLFSFHVDIGERRPGDLLVDCYRVEAIRTGSVGIVYLCEDVNTGERVAIKTYNDEIRWGNPGAVRRFWHEANSWASLPRHRHIVEARQVRNIDGRLHLVLECAEGGDLRSRLRIAIPSTAEALKIGLDVCFGLRAVHQAGLVHRDVKPENILFDADGTAKVSDLGLAVALEGEREIAAAGTRGYWAPEQIAHPDQVTASADIHALGVVLYELLAGTRPEIGAPPLTLLGTRFGKIVDACREPDPRRRPTLADLTDVLATTYRDLTGKTYAPSAEPVARSWSLAPVLSLAALERIDEALRLCEARLSTNPGDQSAFYGQALCLYDLGRYQECVRACLESLRARGPKQGWVTRNLSILLEMGAARQGVQCKDAASWTMLGQMTAYGEGDVRSALRFADLALEIDQLNEFSWHLRAQCLYNLGRYEESLECYEQAARVIPEGPVADLLRRESGRVRAILSGQALAEFRVQREMKAAQQQLDGGDAEAAERHLRQVLAAEHDHLQARLLLGSAALALGRPQEALDRCEQVLGINKDDAHGWALRSKALRLLRRYPEALESADRAVGLRPSSFTWHEKGMSLLVMGRYPEAKESFEEARRLNPEANDSRVLIDLCDSYMSGAQEPDTSYPRGHWFQQGVEHAERGRLQASLDCLRAGLDLEPDDPDLLYNAGYVLWRMGLHSAAVQYCRRVIELVPSNAEAWNILGNALDDLGDESQALAAFEHVLQLDDKHADGWNGQGLCQWALGHSEEALKSFERACALQPSLSRAWFNRAETLYGLSRYEEAIRCYDRALATDGLDATAHHGRGLALMRLGRHAEAAESLRRAITENPSDGTVWNSLGAVQAQLGDRVEAMKSFSRALQLSPSLTEPQSNLKNLRNIQGS